jgi:uncharacterized protein (TIGR03084 family)
MDRVVEALGAEQAELRRLLEALPDDGWAAPTRCDGWDVADVVTHLAQTDEMAVASATGRYEEVLSGLTTGLGPADSVDSAVDAMVGRERGTAPKELFERWSSGGERLIEALDSMNLSARVMWVTGELSARSMATTRLAETWIHSGDIASAVGVILAPTDRLVHITRLAWRTLPYAFGTSGRTMSGSVAFHLTSPSGEAWDFVPDDEPLTTITGSAAELCDVASRRVEVAQTALQGTGPDAEVVLSVVRTYA